MAAKLGIDLTAHFTEHSISVIDSATDLEVDLIVDFTTNMEADLVADFGVDFRPHSRVDFGAHV